MISINRKRLTEIKKRQIATDLIDNKRSNALVYLVLVFNVNGAKHKIINIESMSDVDKLLTSKYLHKARNCNFNATNREQNVYYAYHRKQYGKEGFALFTVSEYGAVHYCCTSFLRVALS